MVGRPNYNSRNLESASIVISVSILLNTEANEGPPRYFSVASGQEDVRVRDIFVTNLDRVGSKCGKRKHVTIFRKVVFAI